MTVKLKFSHQQFQDDAVNAVCSAFTGQPFGAAQTVHEIADDVITHTFTVWENKAVELSDSDILDNIRDAQKRNGLPLSPALDGKYNLTVEMETGTGKTYTYIKTIYELHKLYGWSKFIIVVPSIAIREGVYKTFTMTEEHFAWEYEHKADYFIYNSADLSRLGAFASDSGLQVMIINSQAFNARDANTKRIRMEIDSFGSVKPIEMIAAVRPVVIIDEPQSVEGAKTKESLKDFCPLFTLRYSATPRERYNLVYRLDAMDAYNMKLVKSISVIGVKMLNASASGGYVYLKEIVLSERDPLAVLEFDFMSQGGIKRITRRVREGFDLFTESGGLEEYRSGYVVRSIDGLNGRAEFLNGITLSEGELCGSDEEDQKRRIQIRETINTHLEKEAYLFRRGIKVLSLFFIDEVAKYRLYDDAGQVLNGIYARIFEEEYRAAAGNLQLTADKNYCEYLGRIEAGKTHAGYFSVDRNNRMTESRINSRREGTTDDVSAYDLIMKDKERLLSFDEPVRFIFSHSALREGWDNPNVFQICALRNTRGEVRRRQEVGRGLRLCVNQTGDRIDGEVNELTVIANESYADFASQLQREIAESLGGRPSSINIADRKKSRTLHVRHDMLARPEFLQLWENINRRSVYSVDFDDGELVRKASSALNGGLNVAQSMFMIQQGRMSEIESKDSLEARHAFTGYASRVISAESQERGVKLDLAGCLAGMSGLTREAAVKILKGVDAEILAMFARNPEMFTVRAAQIITEQKAGIVVEHVSYNMLDETYSADIFTDITINGQADMITHKLFRTLYDYIVCDSEIEKGFAEELDAYEDVTVYAKLPRDFYIETPAGRYSPDWAAAFVDGRVKHTYFVAETKGSMSSQQLRPVEQAKAKCAQEHFKTLSGGKVKYSVISSFAELINLVKG